MKMEHLHIAEAFIISVEVQVKIIDLCSCSYFDILSFTKTLHSLNDPIQIT